MLLSNKIISLDMHVVLTTLCADLDIHSSTVQYLTSRFKNEGIAFLTVTLPKLATMVLKAIEFNSLPAMKPEFTCFRWKGGAPLHFKWLTDQIFDVTGSVRADACEVALYQIRQLSHYCYKLALEFSDEQLDDAEDSFMKVEQSLSSTTKEYDFVEKVRKNVESNFRFPKVSDVLSSYRPRNGPGTFSQDGRSALPWYEYKYSHQVYNSTLAKYKGISGYFRAYPSSREKIKLYDCDTADYSEVLFVPKDSRGPRVIMREPLHALQLQMSFFDWFSSFLEKETRGHVNFTDQSVNRRLAEQGSRDGSWATLDLKEASDRVSYSVVKQIARNIPVLNWFLSTSRTKNAKLPSGKIMQLKKLAGMGSGLTFTWLSFLIYASVATEISIATGTTFGAASRHVYTYGDDLIVPVCYVQEAKNALRKVDLIINDSKSFYRKAFNITKCFRESCGGDYYGGADVSITRLKLQNCSLKVSKRILEVSGTQAIVMIAEHAGELKINGLNQLAEYMYTQLEKCTGPLPLKRTKSSVIGRLTRNHVVYPTSKDGTYTTLKVICATPVLLEIKSEHHLYKYSLGLAAQGADDPLGFLDGDTTALLQGVTALPRTVQYKFKRISAFSLVG